MTKVTIFVPNRNTGLGSCSLVARFGGILATTVGKLSEINVHIPTVLFGGCALISAVISFWLPETAGKPLPSTIEDCEMYDTQTRGTKKGEESAT